MAVLLNRLRFCLTHLLILIFLLPEYQCPLPVPENLPMVDGLKFSNEAGPTTSIREEPYQGEIIRKFKVRAVIGKGGMGAKTLAAMKDVGAVYLSAIGGAAQYYSKCIEDVEGVDFMEFGVPEAMWHVRVKDFPVIVTMDAHGKRRKPAAHGA